MNRKAEEPEFCQTLSIRSNGGTNKNHLILQPGLMDGLFTSPYITALASKLDSIGWSLVQPLISSSYQGYGTGSLDRDADELHDLCACLKKEMGCSNFVLMGHSTGCQDTVRFMKRYSNAQNIPNIAGAVLLAPVSDQEYQETLPETKDRIKAAKKMVDEGNSEEILFRDYSFGGVPLCARRYLALAERYGDDDHFSSYFTDKELKDLLGHMSMTNCLIIFCGSDEYVPKHVDKDLLCKKFVKAIGPKSEYHIIEGGTHYLPGKEQELTNLVVKFIKG